MDANKFSYNGQRFLIPDPVAIEFISGDKDVRIINSQQELPGFELYIVEQWACSRLDPTIAITTFTGQMQHKLQAAVIEISCKEGEETTEVQNYLGSLSQHHTRRHETPLGQILVTNLSTFPSTLTILTVPDGDIKKHRPSFVVNENLKRLGCSGRAGINLTHPTEVTLSRFRTLYKISDRVKVSEAITELVQMCQVALSMFTKLDANLCDGLLCDLTQKGLSDWWTDIGLQHYNIEPTDGILGPTTTAALLGLFLGARNRLHMYGAPVSKDAFDIKALKRGIAYFQKSQRLVKTRRLDHLTLQRLHKVTAKAVHHDGWAVPRAVKSTVAELGKGGEMVMGMVGVRERASPADIETAKFDQFLKQISGDQCKWLWHGKRRKTISSRSTVDAAQTSQLLQDEASSRTNWSSGSDDEEGWVDKHMWSKNPSNLSDMRNNSSSVSKDKEETYIKKTSPFKNRRIGDNKGGLERIREAMNSGMKLSTPKTIVEVVNKPDNISDGEVNVDRRTPWPLGSNMRERSHVQTQSADTSKLKGNGSYPWLRSERMFQTQNTVASRPVLRRRVYSLGNLVLGKETQVDRFRSTHFSDTSNCSTSSAYFDLSKLTTGLDENMWLSSTLNAIGDFNGASDHCYPASDIKELTAVIFDSKKRYIQASSERSHDVEEIREKYHSSSGLLHTKVETRRKENSQHAKLFDEIRQDTDEALKERLREVEALGARLEYELGVLTSKIEEVEEGVADLDRQVSDLESRSRSLEHDSRHHTWQHWTETLVRRIGIV